MEQKRTDRLEFIKSLSDKGMNSVEISNYLNSNNIKSPKGLLYNPKLIWVTLNKYKIRLTRLESERLLRVKE